MASFADEALPSLPPIKTAPLAPGDAASASPATSTTTTQESATAEDTTKASAVAVAVTEDREEEPSTPTSEESRLRTPTACPPAPRKPPVPRMPSVKRKSRPTLTTTTTSRVCLAVPRDLSAVFRSMPMPPEKRIRAS